MGSPFEPQIAKVEGEIEALRPEMEAARNRWLGLAADFLAEFWPRAARAIVQQNPLIARDQLRASGVKALRDEVEGLAGRAPELLTARVYLEDREGWPDTITLSDLLRDPPRPQDFFSHETSSGHFYAPSFLGESFGRTAGLGGEVLASKGFPLSFPFEEKKRYDNGVLVGTVRARHLPWSEEMAVAINAYAVLVTDMTEALSRLEQVHRERDEADAGDLWDQAGAK